MADDTPLTAQEVAAWAKGTATELSPWEFEMLLRLSVAYSGQRYASRKQACPAPWVPAPTDINRAKVAKDVRGFLRE